MGLRVPHNAKQRMKLLKSMIQSGDGGVYEMDTVRHEGHFWLVPEWLEIPNLASLYADDTGDESEKLIMPARIIQIDPLEHQKTEIHGAQFVVTYPIPKSVLTGQTQTAEGVDYIVEERPHIHIPSDKFQKLDPCFPPSEAQDETKD